MFGDTIERIVPFDVMTGEMGDEQEDIAVYAATTTSPATRSCSGPSAPSRWSCGSACSTSKRRASCSRRNGSGAHRARPRDAGRNRRLLGHRELQPHLDGRPGRGALHAARLLPKDYLVVIDESHVAVPSCTASSPATAPARHAGRARLPPALCEGQPPSALRRIHRAGPQAIFVSATPGPSRANTRRRWSSR